MSTFIVVKARITDVERFTRYTSIVPDLVTRFGGRYRVLGSNIKTLEGLEDDRKVVISEWPDRQAAERFWNSQDYREAARLRQGCGEFEVIMVDGID